LKNNTLELNDFVVDFQTSVSHRIGSQVFRGLDWTLDVVVLTVLLLRVVGDTLDLGTVVVVDAVVVDAVVAVDVVVLIVLLLRVVGDTLDLPTVVVVDAVVVDAVVVDAVLVKAVVVDGFGGNCLIAWNLIYRKFIFF